MVITFAKERKRQQYLILILLLVVFGIAAVLWWGFFKEEGVGTPVASPILTPLKVEINWETLKDPQLQELQSFEEITSFEEDGGEEVGRKNPFTPY